MDLLSRIALVTCDESLTYAEMLAVADEIASHVEKGSLVLLVASNTVSSVCGYVGFLRKGAVPLMLPEGSDAKRILEAYNPAYIWARAPFFEGISESKGWRMLAEDRGYRLVATGAAQAQLHSDLSLLLTTSGSTGTPKLVRLSAANIAANAESIAEYQRIDCDDRAITTLPFSYAYGISIVNSHLLRGASLVLTEEGLFSRGFWELLRKADATNFGGVPYTYSMLEKLHFDRMETPSLRFISQAGGRLGERLQELFAGICAKKGIEFYVMYGQTEATARMSWLPPEFVASKLGSIGAAIPGGEFSIVDDGRVLEEVGAVGELVYRGANVSLGYAECAEDLAKGDERGGVLETGDIARRDEDGFYYIVGRKKRFLKIFGNRVNLDEVEAMCAGWGFEAACAGADDALAVFVVGSADGVVDRLAKATGLHPSAFSAFEVDVIPRTSSGKIDYAALGGMLR